MSKSGYKTIDRMICFLSFICAAVLFYFISPAIAAGVLLISFTVLIPKVEVKAIRSFSVPEWCLAFFSSALLACSVNTFDVHPATVIIILLGVLCVPSAAFSIRFISDLSRKGFSAKDISKDKKDTSLSIKETSVLFLGSTAVITLMSASSPLYPFNYWDDANIYLTIGRCIKHGLVLYRDAYDHKGPTLFFIHAIAAVISEKSFLGVWLIEIAENFLFCLFAWKIVKIYLKPSFFTIMTVPAMLSLLCFLSSFYFGDSAEEMCLPVLAAILFMSLRYTESVDPLPVSHAFITGLLTGFLFWLKYTFCGIVLGLAVFVIIDMIRRKKIAELLRTAAAVTGGLVAFSVPIILYFVVNNATDVLFTTYFYNNITYYTAIVDHSGLLFSDVPVLGSMVRMFYQMSWDLGRDTEGFILLFISGAAIMGSKKRSRLLFFLCFGFTALGIYIGKTVLYYYCHLLMAFVPLSLIPVIILITKAEGLLRKKTRLSGFIVSFLLIIVILMNIIQSANFFFLTTVSKEDLPQYKFAEIINRQPSASILNYDAQDIGLFTFTGNLPANRYFTYYNIDMPAIKEEQLRLIDEGFYDYIVTRSPEYDWEGYEIVAYEHFQFLGIYKKLVADDFYLYRRV